MTTSVENVKLNDDFFAWRQGENVWRLVDNGYTYAHITYKVTRKRRRDLSGVKEFRVFTSLTANVDLYVGYTGKRFAFTFEDHGGEKASLKRVIGLQKSENWLFKQARYELDLQALKELDDYTRMKIGSDSLRYGEGGELYFDEMTYIRKMYTALKLDEVTK